MPYKCPGKMVLSPYDNCNQCTCNDDGGCMKIGTCTKIGCPGTKQKTGQLCSVALNNCADPTICTNDTRVLSIDICTKDVGKYVFKNFVPWKLFWHELKLIQERMMNSFHNLFIFHFCFSCRSYQKSFEFFNHCK